MISQFVISGISGSTNESSERDYSLFIFTIVSLQVKNDHVAPIYVINLLISDVIQLCCMIVDVVPLKDRRIYYIGFYMYYFAMIASVGFMVCIALER